MAFFLPRGLRCGQLGARCFSQRPRFSLVVDGMEICRHSTGLSGAFQRHRWPEGDVFGPKHFEGLRAALTRHGELRKGYVCAQKGTRWTPRDLQGLELISVPRRAGGKDPNDIAISLEAARLVFQENVDAIALAAADLDFLYLVEVLQRHGARVLVLLPRQCNAGVARAFRETAEVEWFSFAEEAERQPKKKMLLSSKRCSSVFEDLKAEDFDHGEVGLEMMDQLRAMLLDWGYLEDQTQALLPAVAKFAVLHELEDFPLWPKSLAYTQLAKVISKHGVWKRNDHRLIFVLPCGPATASKKWLEACGSSKAVSYVRAGGAFLLRESEAVALEVLQRLGYYGDMNEDLSEAIDIFASMKSNDQALQVSGLSIKPHFSVHRKMALLHAALVSPRVHGEWHIAPGDDLARRFLVARGLLAGGQGADRKEVWRALESFLEQSELPRPRSYNAAVKQLNLLLSSEDPSSRSPRVPRVDPPRQRSPRAVHGEPKSGQRLADDDGRLRGEGWWDRFEREDSGRTDLGL
ncbi:unnamed protein product [Durusdinium trenchii]|uniref:NYN domain-containing protein n=1 Tax=Durusdinium trenchii TaxID=1381693 RepID=A0ABP0PHC2_9DINO